MSIIRIQGVDLRQFQHGDVLREHFDHHPTNTMSTSNTFLQLLATPNRVISLQQILSSQGHPLIADGFFGPSTGEAFGKAYNDGNIGLWMATIPDWQEMHSLQISLGEWYSVTNDGYFGPQTGKALGDAMLQGRVLPTHTTTEKGITLLKDFEKGDWRDRTEYPAYICPTGVPSIGFGHTATVTQRQVEAGYTITPQEAENFLQRDLRMFEEGVMRLVTVPIGREMFSACVLLAFNIGLGGGGGEGFAESTVLRMLNAKQFDEAAYAFKLWNKGMVGGRKVAIDGLTRRREAEANLFRSDLC